MKTGQSLSSFPSRPSHLFAAIFTMHSPLFSFLVINKILMNHGSHLCVRSQLAHLSGERACDRHHPTGTFFSLLKHTLVLLLEYRKFILKGLVATVLYKHCIHIHILKYLAY